MVIKIQKISIKYSAILITVILLVIPMVFGIYLEFFRISQLDLFSGFLVILGFIVIIIIGKTVELYVLDDIALVQMKKHDVTNALIFDDNKLGLYFFFH